MKCLACQTEFPATSTACPSCGAPKPRFCAECGAQLVPSAKFCSECGTRAPEAPVTVAASAAEMTALEPPLPPELRKKFEDVRSELSGERREVAVLFADMSGFTAMSETLDPEETSLLMNRLLNSLAETVYRYEGYVDKYIGDAVMALFGAPLAHENDPERAVLAGLGMLQVVERHNRTAEASLAIRVGINLGEVVAAHLGTGMRLQYTVMGDTVNVASRLEGKAAPNTILVSDSVFRRVSARFKAEKLPPLQVKGKTQPIQTYRILGLQDGASLAEQSLTPFVGREGEIQRLQEMLLRMEGGHGAALLIEAEAGTGKTRLIREALARSAVDTQTIEVAFNPIRLPGQRPALGAIFYQLLPEEPHGKSAIDRALSLLGAGAETHQSGIEDLAREADPSSDVEAPADLDPKIARQNRWLATLALLRAAAAIRPILLLIEDIHWIDEATQEFFDLLAQSLSAHPIGLLLTSRPRPKGSWLPRDTDRIVLAPLDSKAAATLLGELLDDMPLEGRRELIRRSEGNPLFLEELARALRQSAEEGLSPESVPGTLQGLLVSRIDRLEPPARLLLQMSAVLGFGFPTRLLGQMYRLETQPLPFEGSLRILEEEGLLESEVNGEVRHRFHHALIQEVAYKGLLIRIRKVLHESAARLGEQYYADRLEAEAPFFAHQYWQAGLLREAVPHLWAAGRHAAERYDLPSAERFLEQAAEGLATFPEVLAEPAERMQFADTFGEVLLHRGKLAAAEAQFLALEELGASEGRDDWRAQAFRHRGRVAWYHGSLDDARDLFERGLECRPDPPLAADLYNDLGIVFYYRGNEKEAFDNHARALALREELQDKLGLAKSYSNIGNLLVHFRDDLARAWENYQRALELSRSVGDRRETCSMINNLGFVAMERGEWHRAMELFAEANEIQQEIGWSFSEYVTLQNRIVCEISLGKVAEAMRHLRLCVEKGDAFLEPMNRVNTRLFQFDAYLRACADDDAERALEEARSLAVELKVEEQEEELRLRDGRLLAARGRWAEAAEAFRAAEDAARRLNHPPTEKLARAHRCRAEARAGNLEAETCSVDLEGRPPLVALIRYLNADADAEREPSTAAAVALGKVGDEASALGEICLERAAFERQAEVWAKLEKSEEETVARRRAEAAMRAFAENLPADRRATFATHPRNAGLRQAAAT